MTTRALGTALGGLLAVGAALVVWNQLGSRQGDIAGAFDVPAMSPTISLQDDPASPDFGSVEIGGLAAAFVARLSRAEFTPVEWGERFAVYAGSLDSAQARPSAMLGTYESAGTALRFHPRFPPVGGMTYTATIHLGAWHVDTSFALPVVSGPPTTRVTRVFPSADVLPMNQLRMYVHFSAPMSVGQAYEHLRLIDDESRRPIEDPFVIIEEELWDPDKRRFTLLFDPGRIKRGLRPHEEAGLPLQDGKRYRLVVDAEWHDAGGAPLVEPFEKRFGVGPQDRQSPDHATWAVSVPAGATRDPLTLTFPESLDQGLLQHMVGVRTGDGEAVVGEVHVLDRETVWRFVPTQPWRAGEYVIRVDTNLEDLAGNSLRRLFDVNLETDPSNPLADVALVEKPFVVR